MQYMHIEQNGLAVTSRSIQYDAVSYNIPDSKQKGRGDALKQLSPVAMSPASDYSSSSSLHHSPSLSSFSPSSIHSDSTDLDRSTTCHGGIQLHPIESQGNAADWNDWDAHFDEYAHRDSMVATRSSEGLSSKSSGFFTKFGKKKPQMALEYPAGGADDQDEIVELEDMSSIAVPPIPPRMLPRRGSVNLKLTQMDLCTGPMSPYSPTGRQTGNRFLAPGSIPALSRFAGEGKTQTAGHVKLVLKAGSNHSGEPGSREADLESDNHSIYTTITTATDSSGGSTHVPVYGRGGAARANPKTTTKIYHPPDGADNGNDGASMMDASVLSGDSGDSNNSTSSASGRSGGKRFIANLVKGKGGNRPRTAGGGAVKLVRRSVSHESLATIREHGTLPEIPVYGRGGAARRKVAPAPMTSGSGVHLAQDADGLAATDQRSTAAMAGPQKSKSRTAALVASLRKGESVKSSMQEPSQEGTKKADFVPVYGRGGASRR